MTTPILLLSGAHCRKPASQGEAVPRDILRDGAAKVIHFVLSALIAAWAAARRAIGTRNGEQLT